MLLAGGIAAAIGGLNHVWIFLLESVWFDRPSVHRRFGVRGFAFNHGFYNLFLALGAALGLALMVRGAEPAERIPRSSPADGRSRCSHVRPWPRPEPW